MARTGRPPKLDARSSLTIIETLRAGAYIDHAAARAGVSRATVYAWLDKGKNQSTGLYRDFLDAVMQARADAVIRNVALIQNAARNDWRAAAWYLERTLPEMYGRVRVPETPPMSSLPSTAGAVDSLDRAAELVAAMIESGIVDLAPLDVVDEADQIETNGHQ